MSGGLDALDAEILDGIKRSAEIAHCAAMSYILARDFEAAKAMWLDAAAKMEPFDKHAAAEIRAAAERELARASQGEQP
jgi:hypothetical protein